MIYELRKAQNSDISFLIELRAKTMNCHLLNSGVSLDADEQMARIMYRFDCAEIISVEGHDIGLLKLVKESDPWEIVQIQIEPMCQGCGLGSSLINKVVEDAIGAGCGLVLSVLKSNPARYLYERAGFRVVSESDTEYCMRLVESQCVEPHSLRESVQRGVTKLDH